MQEYSLEREFTEWVYIHKSSIVMGSLIKYYADLDNTGVTIPDFMNTSVEDKAKDHYFRLLADRSKFNETYEACWEKYKEMLP